MSPDEAEIRRRALIEASVYAELTDGRTDDGQNGENRPTTWAHVAKWLRELADVTQREEHEP